MSVQDGQYGDNYGDNLSVWEKIRILQEWAPVLTYVQAFLGVRDAHQKSLIVMDAAEWLASKTTGTKVDDELVSHLDAILKSEEGEAFLRWVLNKAGEASK